MIDSDDDEPSPSSEPSIVEASANMLRAFRGYPSSQELDTKPSLVDSSQSANLTAQATIDRLTRELAAEREKNRTLTEARNDLQQKLCDKEVDTEKQIQLQLENETLQRQIQNIEAQYATQQQDSAKLLDEALISAQKSKAETLSLQERLTTVESQHHHMQQELTTLQTTHPGPLQPPAAVQHALSLPSPAPSSQCSSFSAAMASSAPLIEQLDEETKENNVRKMYMKTKRQYDVLHAVCSNLVTCTRSIELSSFGEFGGYVRQLRDCLG